MAQEKQGIWIARDKNGERHGFIVKPTRGKDKWEDNYRMFDDNFDWSKWHTEFTWENEPIFCDNIFWLEQVYNLPLLKLSFIKFMTHYDYYKTCLKDVETLKDRIESKIGLELRQYGKHLFIGNMVYSYHMKGGKPIPTYCYKCDYKEGENNKFYPIYDRNGIYLYGWNDFSDCCRTYDVISNEINNRS